MKWNKELAMIMFPDLSEEDIWDCNQDKYAEYFDSIYYHILLVGEDGYRYRNKKIMLLGNNLYVFESMYRIDNFNNSTDPKDFTYRKNIIHRISLEKFLAIGDGTILTLTDFKERGILK